MADQQAWLASQPEDKVHALVNELANGKLDQFFNEVPPEVAQEFSADLELAEYSEIIPGLPILKLPLHSWYAVSQEYGISGLAASCEHLSFIILPNEAARTVLEAGSENEIEIHELYHIYRELSGDPIVDEKDVPTDPLLDRFQNEFTAYITGLHGDISQVELKHIDPEHLTGSKAPDDLLRIKQTSEEVDEILKIAQSLGLNGFELIRPVSNSKTLEQLVDDLLTYVSTASDNRLDILTAARSHTKISWSNDDHRWIINPSENKIAQMFLDKADIVNTSSPTEAALFFCHCYRDEFTLNQVKYSAQHFAEFAQKMMGQDIPPESLFAIWMQQQELCSYESGLVIAEMEFHHKILVTSQIDDDWPKNYAHDNFYQAIFSLGNPNDADSVKYLNSFQDLVSRVPEIKSSITSNLDELTDEAKGNWESKWGTEEFNRRHQALLEILK